MDWQTLWNWLSDANNRDTLGFIGAGLAAVVAGVWALYKHFSSRSRVAASPPRPDLRAATAHYLRYPTPRGGPNNVMLTMVTYSANEDRLRLCEFGSPRSQHAGGQRCH